MKKLLVLGMTASLLLSSTSNVFATSDVEQTSVIIEQQERSTRGVDYDVTGWPVPPLTPEVEPAGYPDVKAWGIAGTQATSSPWVLYEDGTLVLYGGAINQNYKNTWMDYYSDIERIVIGASYNGAASTVKFPADISYMFQGLYLLQELVTVDIDTSAVTNMQATFRTINNIEHLDLSAWDVSNVTNMSALFEEGESLLSLDVSTWDTSNVKKMNRMFGSVKSITSLNLNSWDVSSVEKMQEMFLNTLNLKQLDIDLWNTAKVEDMSDMFYGTMSLENLNISNWNTSNVKQMDGMFENSESLTRLDLNSWDVSNVETMSRMFLQTLKLEELNIKDWNTASLTDMQNMFSGAWSIRDLDLSGWDASNIVDMAGAFSYMNSLVEVQVGNWNTDSLKYIDSLFQYSSSLARLDIRNWNTRGVIDMNYMLDKTFKLRSITLGSNSILQEIVLLSDSIDPMYTNAWVLEDGSMRYEDAETFMNNYDGSKDGKYERELATHNVEFKDKDGMSLRTVNTLYNSVLDLSDVPSTPLVPGHTFVEWNTQIDGLGTTFDPITDYVFGDMIVYPIYSINVMNVVFDDEGTQTTATTNYNTLLNIADVPTPTKAGHTFKEWNTLADGTGTAFDPTSDVITSDQTLYAVYTINSYTLIFDVEGTMTSVNVDHGSLASGVPTPSKVGYTFKEWNTLADGTGTAFDPLSDVVTSNQTLYAVFTINTYTVIFDVDGDTTAVMVNHGDLAPAVPTPTKVGYTFKEWNTKADGTGTVFDIANDLVTSNQTVYAIFEKDDVVNYTYTVIQESSTYEGIGDWFTRVDAPFHLFKEVKVNGLVLDTKHYTVKSGSTVVTFKESYLKTLDSGIYNVGVVFTDGNTVSTTLEVNVKQPIKQVEPTKPKDTNKPAIPNTGVELGNNFVLLLAGAGIVALLAFIVIVVKKKSSKK